ncbi:uncharacterized protein [Penaeus vannamei]|uniref:uncharacterized protein n=1 Tax=Penaeus vannamei TaxID=6689 RepID=UPI00387F5937
MISKLENGKAAGICSIPDELLKAGCEPMAWDLYAILAAIWQFGAVSPDLLRGVVIPLWKGNGNHWTATITKALHCSAKQSRFLFTSFYSVTETPCRTTGGWNNLNSLLCCKVQWGLSNFFPGSSGVRQGGVLAPTLLNTCMGLNTEQRCGTTLGKIKVTDLEFTDVIQSLWKP